jgi:UPF0716 protein FxsA
VRWFLAGLLLLPVVELTAAIEVGRAIGALATVGALLLIAVVGLFVVRREGAAAWRSLNRSVRTGEPPSRDLADATVLMLAGILLIIPGFVTDVFALLLLFPLTRPLARRPVERALLRAAAGQAGARSGYGPPPTGPHDVIEGEIVD